MPKRVLQADYALASLDALPAVAAAVAGRVPVLMDGGVRRGTDIIKVGSSRAFTSCLSVKPDSNESPHRQLCAHRHAHGGVPQCAALHQYCEGPACMS